jgi:hypothetical protein
LCEKSFSFSQCQPSLAGQGNSHFKVILLRQAFFKAQ